MCPIGSKLFYLKVFLIFNPVDKCNTVNSRKVEFLHFAQIIFPSTRLKKMNFSKVEISNLLD